MFRVFRVRVCLRTQLRAQRAVSCEVVAPRKGDWEFIQDALLAAQKEGSGPVRLKWDWWNEADSAVKLMNLIC